jgi:hypothetical protein
LILLPPLSASSFSIWTAKLHGNIQFKQVTMSFYKDLDHTTNEVRVLTIIEPPEGDTSGLVHCKLEHVPLDEVHFTPEYAQFLSETNQTCNDMATRGWLEKK